MASGPPGRPPPGYPVNLPSGIANMRGIPPGMSKYLDVFPGLLGVGSLGAMMSTKISFPNFLES